MNYSNRVITGITSIIIGDKAYVRESEELINQLKYIANHEVEMCLSNQIKEWRQTKIWNIYKETRKRPIILPIIKNIKTTKNLGCINLTYS